MASASSRGEEGRPPAVAHQGGSSQAGSEQSTKAGGGEMRGQMNKGGKLQQYRPVQKEKNQTEEKIATSAVTPQTATQQPTPPPNSRTGMQTNPQRIFCHRCKGFGHMARDCSNVVFCINCAKPTHRTEDCIYDKQPRPMAKLVGYGAPGLGCILIQNTKPDPPKEHNNPLAMISTVFGGELTEAQLEQGFTQQFKWNWVWKAKAMPNGSFQMRFRNKIKFDELANFDYFNVKGTDVQVNVKEWTQKSEAVGKLHIVWVKITGIPEEMKGYQALYEIGSNLGPVLEVDMATFRASNVIRAKVGMMELGVLPLKLVLTSPKGLLFQAHFSLEEVVELGWFSDQLDDTFEKIEIQENTLEGSSQREGKQVVVVDPMTEDHHVSKTGNGLLKFVRSKSWCQN